MRTYMHCNTPSFSLLLTYHPGVAYLAMSASGPFSEEKVLSFYTRNINWVYLSLCLISIYSWIFISTLEDAMKRHFILFTQTRMDSIMALSWPLLRRKLYSVQYKICSKSRIRIFRNWKKKVSFWCTHVHDDLKIQGKPGNPQHGQMETDICGCYCFSCCY